MLKIITLPEDLWPRRRDWSGEIVEVFIETGQWVNVGDPLFEVEIEKVILQIDSPYNGKVLSVLVKRGDKVYPGTPLAELEV
jgi:biotin carboxyl carrier protein